MLDQEGISHTYREYTKEPLGTDEIRSVLKKLNCGPRTVLRTRDAKKAGLSGNETDDELIDLMAQNPRLLQRPIGIVGDKAVVGRPPEDLLSLL